MYNKERKLLFIEKNKYRNVNLEYAITNLFESIGKYEELNEKDACNFSLVEICSYYKTTGTASLESLLMNNSYLKLYTDWCISLGYVKDNQNHYSEMNNEIFVSQCINTWIKDRQIFTRKEILDICKQLDNYGDKFIVLGLFEGVYGVKCCELSSANLENLKGNTLVFADRTITISDTLKSYLKEAVNQYEYIPYGTEGVREQFFYDKTDVRAIKRMYNSHGYDTPEIGRARIATRLRRINAKIGVDLGTKSLIHSGMIDMLKGFVEKDKALDSYECMINHKKEIEARYGAIASVKRFCTKYEDYLK